MAEEKVSLRLLVDKERNRIVCAEAGKDFMDALLSFLTLPLGTIARIVGRYSNLKPVRVGSLSSLYKSVANLEEKHFWTKTCKEMLLHPRNSMESHQNLKLNIDDSEPIKYFVCENLGCSREEHCGYLSTFKNTRCRCGKVMNQEIQLSHGGSLLSRKINEGYVNEFAAFTLSDDLRVMPSNLISSIVLLKNLGIEDMDSVEEMNVNVNQIEMVNLLKSLLLSETPLTDLFLRKEKVQEDFEPYVLFPLDFIRKGKVPAQADMKVKVAFNKSESKVLFLQAEEDFADFLLSFLTLPLGSVLNLLEGNSGCICLDNLFKSLLDLDASKHLMSQEIKKMLIKPQIAPQFKLQNQILPIDEANVPRYYFYSGETLTLLDPKFLGGYAKGPSMYMITDDLVVTPISSISVASFLDKSKIPLHDLEERVISIGLEEVLSILKASLISSSALTMGLLPFIGREKKERVDCLFSLFREFILKKKINV